MCKILLLIFKDVLQGVNIADILGVSRRTVERRLHEFGVSCKAVYSSMSISVLLLQFLSRCAFDV